VLLKQGSEVVYKGGYRNRVCSTGTCKKKLPVTLQDNTRYRWRVKAYVGGRWRPWSDSMRFRVTTPCPGVWEGQGNFTGSFRVQRDGARITDFEGSFWTPICGRIDVPGDLTPPAEIEIPDNEFSVFMNIPDTITFLDVDGTFNTEKSVEGDYAWGVEGCGFGLTRIDWSASWQRK